MRFVAGDQCRCWNPVAVGEVFLVFEEPVADERAGVGSVRQCPSKRASMLASVRSGSYRYITPTQGDLLRQSAPSLREQI